MRSLVSPLALGFGACVATMTIAEPARAADDVVTCVEASEQAQQLRDEGKYRDATEKLRVCARDVCPAIVKKDCTEWLTDVDALMPSLVIQARDSSGNDLGEVKVTVDGTPFAERLDGTPRAIDPGEHKIRFEAPGMAPVEKTIIMRAREQNRPLSVTLEPGGDGKKESDGSSARMAAYVLGGVGAVGLGAFAYFWFTGKADHDDLRATCAPSCDPSHVDAAKSKLLIADVSLGVGIAALGVAGYLLLTHKSPPPPESGSSKGAARLILDAHPLPGGGMTTLGARF